MPLIALLKVYISLKFNQDIPIQLIIIKPRGKIKSEIYIQDNIDNSYDLNIWSAWMWNLTLRYQKFGMSVIRRFT